MTEVQGTEYTSIEGIGTDLSAPVSSISSDFDQTTSADQSLTLEELNKLEPLDRIKAIGKEFGLVVRDPDPNCKKCFGRGYLAVKENGEVIPCECVNDIINDLKLAGQNRITGLPRNREERRKFRKNMRKAIFGCLVPGKIERKRAKRKKGKK